MARPVDTGLGSTTVDTSTKPGRRPSGAIAGVLAFGLGASLQRVRLVDPVEALSMRRCLPRGARLAYAVVAVA